MDHSSTLPEEFGLLREELERIPDRRHRRGTVHPLGAVLSLTVLALMCGHRFSERDLQVRRHSPGCAARVGVETQSFGRHAVEAAENGVGVRGSRVVIEVHETAGAIAGMR